MGKPRGLRTARKHVKNRRENVWADLDYKKAHLGTRWKANPFGGASHAKGIVLEKVRYFYYISFASLIRYFSTGKLCQKLFFLQTMGRTCCVQKLF